MQPAVAWHGVSNDRRQKSVSFLRGGGCPMGNNLESTIVF